MNKFPALLLAFALFNLAMAEDIPMAITPITTYDLEKMVITPSRTQAKNILDIPQSVASIGEEGIGSSVKVDVDDYLRGIPGVGMAPSGTAGRTSSNTSNRNSDYWNDGFNIRGLGAQRVLVLTDGIRQSGQGTGYGGGNLSLYDLTGVEKIEVLKGPGSVLYGTDAFGGVVQVLTRDPKTREEFGHNARLRYSIDDSRNVNTGGGFVDVGDKNWGLVLGGSKTSAKIPEMPEGETAQGGSFDKQGGFAKFQYHLTEDSKFRILANIMEAKDINIYNDPDTSFGGNFWFKIPFYQRKMAGVEYLRENISQHLTSAKVGLYTQELKRRFHRSTPYMPPFFPITTYEKTQTTDEVKTTELHGSVVFDYEPHTFSVGVDLGYDSTNLREQHQIGAGAITTRLKADATQKRFGVYAQDEWARGDHTFTFGVRADRFDLDDEKNSSEASEEGLSGSLGYVFRLDPQTSLYATVASGFRSPDLDERYQDTTLNYFTEQVTIRGNPDLEPERSLSFELGAKKDAECGTWEAAFYHNSVSDYIGEVLVSSTPAGPRTIIIKERDNLGDVALYGFELGWRSAKSSPWRNYANVYRTWTDSPDKVAVAKYQFGYGIGYRFANVGPFNAVTPSWSGRYVTGSRDTVANVDFGAYHVADAQVAMEWGKQGGAKTQLIVGIKNVFDRPYKELFFDSYQPARGFFGAVQVDF